ncbi:hypothetical protein K2X33_00680 [bacterium]|nr:hypothetical protein [bacterium]
MKPEKLTGGLTTGIGSLPHHNIDSALEYAFRYDIPFLPQIPMRNPWEYSIPQALEGLPGVRVEKDGTALIDPGVWVGRARAFEEKLSWAFDHASTPDAFIAYEPSAATSSSWQPFLWELQESGRQFAKIQIVGPLTAQWTLRSTEGKNLEDPGLSSSIFRLILARSLAMARRLKSLGVSPLLFIDEPALFVFSPTNPLHVSAMGELKLLIQALQKEEVAVGIHCCSNTQWDRVLETGIDFLSLDTQLSLPHLLQFAPAVTSFVGRGGRFALGVVPTSGQIPLGAFDGQGLRTSVAQTLHQALGEGVASQLLESALWTPACGLALHSPKDAETVLSLLSSKRVVS